MSKCKLLLREFISSVVLEGRTSGKKLRVFDFDDTLVSENEEIKKSISELHDQIIALTEILNK